jgi:hypothetical protein
LLLAAFRSQAATRVGMGSKLEMKPMARHFRFTSRPSRLARLARYVGDVMVHVFGEPYTQLSPIVSRRQQLGAAMEAARRLKRGER